jgi:hypothetical protein
MAARAAMGIALTAGERAALERWHRLDVLAYRTVVRAKVILLLTAEDRCRPLRERSCASVGSSGGGRALPRPAPAGA